MSESLRFVLSDRTYLEAAQAVKSAPFGWVVTIAEPTRNLEQNARFHSLLADIVKHRVMWAGKQWDQDSWKALLISAWSTVSKSDFYPVPGLEGEFVTIRRSSSRMSKAEMSSLIEYVESWMASHAIPIRDNRHAA